MSGVFLRHSVFVSKLWWDDYHPMDSRYWQRSKLLYPTHRVTERCEWPLDSKQVILNVSLAGSRIRLHTRCDKTIFFVQLFTWCSANALSSTFYPLYYPSLSYVISSLNLNHYIYSGAYMLCVACASNSQEKVSCATLHIRHKLRATLQHVHRFTRNLHIVSAIVNHSILVS